MNRNIRVLESIVKMPMMTLPVRSVVVTVQERVILISPGSQLTEASLRSLGTVTDVVAPSLFHVAGMAQATRVFPQAKVWGVSGAREALPEISWTEVLTEKSWEFQNELPIVAIGGMPAVNEVVFYELQSKSLIVTDLCFNLLNVQGLGAKMILGLFGTYQRFGVSRLFLRFVEDKNAFTQSLQQVLKLDFKRIIPSHGLVVEENAKELFVKAFEERGIKTVGA